MMGLISFICVKLGFPKTQLEFFVGARKKRREDFDLNFLKNIFSSFLFICMLHSIID